MFGEEDRSKYALYLGIFLAFGAYGGRLAGIEPFANQFFPAALWTYILLADNVGYRLKGWSPLVSRPEEFLRLLLLSAGLAALGELANLRLGAWQYAGQPSDLPLRWTGRLLAWAGALPSLFVTADLLRSFNFFRELKSRPFPPDPGRHGGLAAAGAALLALALLLPAYAWPLAVPGLLLACEAANLRLGLPSLLRELAGGIPGKTLRLAAAGLACGLLWNWWNAAAGAAWRYLPPRPLGEAAWGLYPGFLLLGPAAYSAAALASWFRGGRSWEDGSWNLPGAAPAPAAGWAAAAALLLLIYIALAAVDRHTVSLYLGWL